MTEPNNETEIRQLVENWARAVRARDMEGVLAHHAADIVMFDVPLPLQSRGMDEYKKTWDVFFAHNRGGPGSFDVTEVQITAGDTVAYCHALRKIFRLNRSPDHWFAQGARAVADRARASLLSIDVTVIRAQQRHAVGVGASSSAVVSCREADSEGGGRRYF